MAKVEQIRVDLTQARQSVAQLAQDIEAAFQLPNLDANVRLQLRAIAEDARRTGAAMDSISDIDVSVDLDTSQLDRAASEIAAIDGADARVEIDADSSMLDQAEAKVSEIDGSVATVDVEADTSGISNAISNELPDLFSKAGLAAGATLGKGVLQALEEEDLQARLGLALGISDEEAEELGAIAGEIYADGFVVSIDAAFQATQSVRRALSQLGDVSEVELDRVTRGALAISTVFDVEVSEQVRAASQLVRNDLAGSFDEAFGLIAAGFQGGLDRGDDFLDTLNEYAPFFRELGVDGPEALALLSQALEAGARDTDKAADSFKEFSIRATEDSEAVREAFASLGFGPEIQASFGAGGAAARTALGEVLDALSDIEDPLERVNIATALFGTQAEDLGPTVFASLSLADDAFENTTGKLDEFNEGLETTSTTLRGIVNGQIANVSDLVGSLIEVLDARSLDDFGSSLAGVLETLDRSEDEFNSLLDLLDVNGITVIGRFVDELAGVEDAIEPGTAERSFGGFTKAAEEATESVRGFSTEAKAVAEGVARDAEQSATSFARSFNTVLLEQQLALEVQAEADQAQFTSVVEELSSLTTAVFGNPLEAAFDPDNVDINGFLGEITARLEAAGNFGENLLAIQASDIFSDDEYDFLLDLFDAAGEEGGALLAQQVFDSFADGSYEDIRDGITDAAEQSALNEIISAQIAAVDTGVTATVSLNTLEIDALAQRTESIRVSADMDDSQLAALLSESYGVQIVANVDDTELDVQEATTRSVDTRLDLSDRSEIDGLETTVSAELDVSAAALVTFRNRLASAGIDLSGGLDAGGVVTQPTKLWIAEKGNPEAVVGGHHDTRLTVDRLQAVGVVTQEFVDEVFRRTMATEFPSQSHIEQQLGGPSGGNIAVSLNDSATARGINDLRSELAAVKSQLRQIVSNTDATAGNTSTLHRRPRRSPMWGERL